MIRQYLYMFLLMLAFTPAAVAQQQPHYTQYLMNPFILNPAMAGIESYWDIKASHRHQWAGLQDAPVTTYLSAHGPLGKYSRNNTTPTDMRYTSRDKTYWDNYSAPEGHPGVGFTVLSDVTGPIRRFAVNAAYAHHIGLGPKTSISLGLGAGMQTYSLDADKLDFADPGDPTMAGVGLMRKWKPDFSAGIWLYSADFFGGVSAQNIIPQELTFDEGEIIDAGERGKLAPHIFITAGYRLWFSNDFSVLPSVMLKIVEPAPLGIDVNAKLLYRDRLWLGANYRVDDGFAGMLGVYITPVLNIGYAYDYTASSLNYVSKGTHEITIGLTLGNRSGVFAPGHNW